MDNDHDRITRLEADLRAEVSFAEQRTNMNVQRFQMEIEDLRGRIDALSEDYREGHNLLVSRVDALTSSLASATGTSAGTMRIFLVAAVGISLLTLIGGLADIITR